MKKIKIVNNGFQKFFLVFFAGLVGFWLYLFLTHHKDGNLNFTYSFLFGLIPLFGGIIGIIKSKSWGGLKSYVGKAIFFISLGLILWGAGETIWSYYNFVMHVAAPYPSLADIGFGPSIFFWIIGTAYLAKATGAIMAFKKSTKAKVLAIALPLLVLAGSYYMLVTVARQGVLVPPGETTLKVILDIIYPLGDFLAATFALVVFTLSFKYFGGFYRPAIMAILVGLGTMYFADFVFSYTTTAGTYYNADWGDLLLTTGLFLMTFGVLGFAVKPSTESTKEPTEVGA